MDDNVPTQPVGGDDQDVPADPSAQTPAADTNAPAEPVAPVTPTESVPTDGSVAGGSTVSPDGMPAAPQGDDTTQPPAPADGQPA